MSVSRYLRAGPVLFLVLLVGLVAALITRPWDPRMSADRAATALPTYLGRARVGCGAGPYLTRRARRACALQRRAHYRCKHEENDGSIVGMKDVDYLCEPVRQPWLSGYWIGTNEDAITDIQPTG